MDRMQARLSTVQTWLSSNRMKALLWSTCAIWAVLAVSPSSRAAAQADQKPPVFATRSQFVALHVSVTDRQGRYLMALPEGAFRVFDNDQPQPIRIFSNEDAPVTVGLLIDSSRSMATIRSLVLTATWAF